MEKSRKTTLINIVIVMVASLVAISVHALMPSPGARVNINDFDSLLVKQFGFPIVASAYFFILYSHVLWVIKLFATKSILSVRKTGWLYGMVFSLLYMVGMQEIVVSSSPFNNYGIDFVLYQFFIGLGDALPVLLLCIFTCWLNIKKIPNNVSKVAISNQEKVGTVGIITVLFLTERIIGYRVGYVVSDISTYPVPTILWTFIFGIVVGLAYLMVISTFNNRERIQIKLLTAVGIIGANWVWFNCFIGLIFKNTIGLMLLRSGIDVVAIIVGAIISGLLFKNKDMNIHKQ